MIDLPDCSACGSTGLLFPVDGPTVEFVKAGAPNAFRIAAWCHRCQRNLQVRMPNGKTGLWAAKELFTSSELDAMPWLESRDAKQRCPICAGYFVALENHHLAPREFFGEECELWPKVAVCRGCHERWHALMGQSIGRHRMASNG